MKVIEHSILLGGLPRIRSFDPSQICFCSMHSMNLGLVLWTTGSALKVLVEHWWIWGEQLPADAYKKAWMHFNGWCKERKVLYLRLTMTHTSES